MVFFCIVFVGCYVFGNSYLCFDLLVRFCGLLGRAVYLFKVSLSVGSESEVREIFLALYG